MGITDYYSASKRGYSVQTLYIFGDLFGDVVNRPTFSRQFDAADVVGAKCYNLMHQSGVSVCDVWVGRVVAR